MGLEWILGEGDGESVAESGKTRYRVSKQASGRAKLTTVTQGKGGPVKQSAYYASPKVAKEAAQRREKRRKS